MFRIMIEQIMGEFGRQLLFAYEANQTILNLIVVTYGLIMFLSWSTLIRIYRHMVLLIAAEIEQDPNLKKTSKVSKIKSAIEIPWQEPVDAAWFPLVANNGGVIPARKSVAVIQRLFDEDELIRHAKEVMEGAPIRKIMPSYRNMVNREMEHKGAKTRNA